MSLGRCIQIWYTYKLSMFKADFAQDFAWTPANFLKFQTAMQQRKLKF